MTRETVDAKARRLLAEGRVLIVRVRLDFVIAIVQGDSDSYDVRHDPSGWSCSCPVRRPECSHIAAVRLVTTATVGNHAKGANTASPGKVGKVGTVDSRANGTGTVASLWPDDSIGRAANARPGTIGAS
jgi:hypothetical protein